MADKSTLYRATTSFAIPRDGHMFVVARHKIVEPSSFEYKARPDLFEEVTADTVRTTASAAVETATQAPGEKRTRSTVSKSAAAKTE